MNRRQWLTMTSAGVLASIARTRSASESRQDRIRRIVRAYDDQGFHRTGTAVDRLSANWLRDEVAQTGLTPELESFALQRVDVVSASVAASGRRIDGVPLFDAGFTGDRGIRGRFGRLDGDGEIGLAETRPNAAGAGPLGDARRQNRLKAIVCVTRGARPGLCPSNADSFLQPFGPPVVQVDSEHAAWLNDQAVQRVDLEVTAQVRRTPADAFNVMAALAGADAALPPLVIMTPRSGWYRCASERAGGIACWLELMRLLRDARLPRDVLFVASSGHELGHLGINAFIDRRPGIVTRSAAWIHLGANIGAAAIAPGQGSTIQASDDELEGTLAKAMEGKGLAIGTRTPRGRVPGGEAEAVHRGGGRYVSIIGANELFHNPRDTGAAAVDASMVDAFVDGVAGVARTLASR